MPIVPVDPSMVTTGGAWSVPGVQPVDPAQAAREAEGVGAGAQAGGGSGASFGDLLGDQMKALQATQAEAANASTALATGTATDPTSVVMAVERARMSMQMASQIRNRATEAFQDVFRTQV